MILSTLATMSEAMDSLMCRYERGISKHDCTEWETQLEEEEIVRKLSGVTCEKRSQVSTRLYGLGKSYPRITCHRALKSLQGYKEPSLKVADLYKCRNK